ncbi:c-type cytochrome biogenesis protein CcmI [Paracoccus caeni]|uniref:C-type cytochrome biogenesis protein CcmI n=1 Tax=Paracoccus caeni TaxID=657651 RepID=A0A934W1S7_9RHOB|nr:c-type cytochrome biogenesis protein CcmI [Paracoccus caeni]MBK4217094.1 c-type cytochrome biogenesis protein CcmI [Paracoccus caeni]
MFWIICAVLVVVVAAAILAPLLRAQEGSASEPAAAFDLRVYRDQLREVDRDLERGVINAEDAGRLRTEIGRKVLEADRRLSAARPAGSGGKVVAAGAVLAVLLGGGVALYIAEGAPGADDQPISARFAEAERSYQNRPSQAEAEAQRSATPAPQLRPEDAELMQQLRDRVAEQPDPQGLELLAMQEMQIGNAVAARAAQEQLVALRGEAASSADLLRLVALMVDAADGVVTPEAEAVLARLIKIDPDQQQGHYFVGLLHLQNGRPDKAFEIWRRLLEREPSNPQWNTWIRPAIADLAWLAGQPDYVAPEAGDPLPGPSGDDIAAASEMSDEERQEFVAGMVSQLEARLAQQGGSPEEWARLISSLVIIGKTDHARAIRDEALQVFAASPDAVATIRAAAEQSGIDE